MKKAIPYIIIGILLFLLFLKSCGNGEKTEPKTIEVEVPEVSGDFEPKEPTHTPIFHNPINRKDSIEIKWKTKTMQNPLNKKLLRENKELLEKYKTAKDSLERLNMYVDAIQIRDFQSHFEDEFLDLTISGKVQGEVKSIFPEYTIKPRTLSTPAPDQKQSVFRLLGGVEFGNNLQFDDLRYKANLGFQNKKGNIFMLGYSRQNGMHYYFLEYDFSIFQVRR